MQIAAFAIQKYKLKAAILCLHTRISLHYNQAHICLYPVVKCSLLVGPTGCMSDINARLQRVTLSVINISIAK